MIKKHIPLIIACLIWILGIPASIALGYQRLIGRQYANDLANFDAYFFSWTQFAGFAVLFFCLGLIALLLAIVIRNQNKNN